MLRIAQPAAYDLGEIRKTLFNLIQVFNHQSQRRRDFPKDAYLASGSAVQRVVMEHLPVDYVDL
jgi:hypothetical protein